MALFISCKEKSVNVEVEQTTASEATNSSSEEIPQENETAIRLNNGVQWEVDDQTTNAIKEMQKTINDLPSVEEARNYPALKEELEREFSEVISNTKLTGDAQSQFENYMSQIKLQFEGLGSQDAATRQEAITPSSLPGEGRGPVAPAGRPGPGRQR